MGSLNTFDLNVYSDEFFDFTEEEYESVLADSADVLWQGYGEWSQELEQGQIVDTPHGPILINRDCSHPTCKSTRCDKDLRIGGISI